MSTVWMFNGNDNFKMTLGASMINRRLGFGCGIYHSSVHLGRPVIVTAGGMGAGYGSGNYGDPTDASEIWDFTVPGSQWQSSKSRITKLRITILVLEFQAQG